MDTPDPSFASQSGRRKKSKVENQELRPVLPRLWDKTCGAALNQSFSKKRLFSQPRQKILLPISEDDSRQSQRSGSSDDNFAPFALFDHELSPISKILQSARSCLPKSPERQNEEKFSDDNNVKLTPNIARRRVQNALKNLESRKRSHTAVQQVELPASWDATDQRPEAFGAFGAPEETFSIFSSDKGKTPAIFTDKDSPNSSNSSPLIGCFDNSEWSP